jgi:hypothetical protein
MGATLSPCQNRGTKEPRVGLRDQDEELLTIPSAKRKAQSAKRKARRLLIDRWLRWAAKMACACGWSGPELFNQIRWNGIGGDCARLCKAELEPPLPSQPHFNNIAQP